MRDKIIELLKEKACNFKAIKKQIKEKSKEELKELLKIMEQNGEIYLTEEEVYIPFPENFKIGKLQFTKAKNPFILYPDGSIQFLNSNCLNGVLNYDTVIINLETTHIEKVLSRDLSQIVCKVKIKNGIKYLEPYEVIGNFKIRIDNNHMKQLQEK